VKIHELNSFLADLLDQGFEDAELLFVVWDGELDISPSQSYSISQIITHKIQDRGGNYAEVWLA